MSRIAEIKVAGRWQSFGIWTDGDENLALLRPPAREWAQIRARIFERDDFTCNYCGQRGGRLECDHIKPVSRGGSHDDDNLTTSCFKCNRSKRAKTLEEWRE